AVAWPWEARKEVRFGEGVDLAVEQVNAAGGVGGRRLRIERHDDQESVNEGRLVAQRIAQDPRVMAVIGHLQSYVSVPAASVYDLGGLLQLSPASTDAGLTSGSFPRVFRGTFTDADVGRAMADYAARRGYRRIAIYYVRTGYGRALANAFEERAVADGLAIVARASYDAGQGSGDARSLAPTLREWPQLDLDAVFLAGEVPLAGALIRQMRELGIRAPVLGGDAMSSPALITVGGPAVEGTVVASSFHPREPRPEVRRFVAEFRARYGVDPDPGSALGYDAVRLLAHAMARAGTAAPAQVAAALHGVRGWPGVTGAFTFDEHGNLSGRRSLKMVVRGGRFEYLPETAADAAAPAAAAPASP
ncbi:MAG TPA: ABC transporter substrate-binding protein, partial [Longimicrobium sp.]|nr:ABC transporter substrate-binding protein [Longimicrobium sp.]